MATAVIVGATGLVGSKILSTLLASPSFSNVHAYTRKKLPIESSKLEAIESSDSETWPSKFPSSASTQSIFFSGLGTTRAQAGGVDKQRKIDFDLNLDLAKAAKEAGVDTYVLISAAGASSSSMVPYSKMKGELEEEVQKLGFKHAIIVRPGLIVGQREDSRPSEFVIRKIASVIGSVSGGALKDPWAQDDIVIARAAVNAGLQCIQGKHEGSVWTLSQADIVRLGKKEWVDEMAS